MCEKMADVTLFCNDPKCVCENKCCQDCAENTTCNKKCEGVKYKEKVYSSDEFLLQELTKAVDKHDNWIVAVALERLQVAIKAEAETEGLRRELAQANQAVERLQDQISRLQDDLRECQESCNRKADIIIKEVKQRKAAEAEVERLRKALDYYGDKGHDNEVARAALGGGE